MTEEQLLAVARRAEVFRKFGLGCLLLGVIFGAGGLIQLLPGDPSDTSDRLLFFGVLGILLLAAGVVLLLIGGRTPPEASTGRIALIRAERQQTTRQLAFLLMPLSLSFMLFGVTRATISAAGGHPLRHLDLFVVGCFAFFVLLFALLLSGRGLDRWAAPVLDDELSRSLRGKAMQFGYLVLVPGIVALLAIGLVRRDLALELTPAVAALGIGAPAIRLFLLERAAGAGEDA